MRAAPKTTAARKTDPSWTALLEELEQKRAPREAKSWGPKTRLLQRVAASSEKPSIKIRFNLLINGAMEDVELICIAGMVEPFWMLIWLGNPPGTQTLGEVISELNSLKRKKVELDKSSIEAKCRNPKVSQAGFRALVEEALEEMLPA